MTLKILAAGLLFSGSGDEMRYNQAILDDQPVVFWSFDGESAWTSKGALRIEASKVGPVRVSEQGPRPPEFPNQSGGNRAVSLSGKSQYLKLADPGKASGLDFDDGEAITIEAWVSPVSLRPGQYAYILGKGRTNNPGVARDNHNYALRLHGTSQGAAISFLFRSAGPAGNWHRWNSSDTFATGDGWHHVAISYRFGEPESISGYIDGEEIRGKWDMGGATKAKPLVDNDELWIGSSMGGNPASSFSGSLDSIAIFRKQVAPERLKSRFQFRTIAMQAPTVIPDDAVLVEVWERIPNKKTWSRRSAVKTDEFHSPAFAWSQLPKKYSTKGIHVDRSDPFLIRCWSRIRFPRGEFDFLVRSRNAARLFVDDKLVAETPFFSIPGTGHGKVEPLKRDAAPGIRPLRRGDGEQIATIQGDGSEHLLRFEMIVGGLNHRPELGETSVSLGKKGKSFAVVSPNESAGVALTNEGWGKFLATERRSILAINAERRRQVSAEESAYWQSRHQNARTVALQWRGGADAGDRQLSVDQFLQSSRPQVDDLPFLKRVTLDTVGTIPTLEEIRSFQRDPAATRRQLVIDRLLADPGWADHWVGYWQDVLAENPNIVNPTLNNTGPFRWWLHEAFLDNKPIDRFVTELVMMEGSVSYGGPGGFALATENDVPMAAKAHIVGQAFLGLQMKCARCHDAPFHSFDQTDLFGMAAMLERKPIALPTTSSVPDGSRGLVTVSLKPGTVIPPGWSFDQIMEGDVSDLLRNPDDSRERLAALITSPQNKRFARVIVNRLWQRYLGRGLVDPVDDWEQGEPRHTELHDYLAQELLISGYDLKHVARLILRSALYQQSSSDAEQRPDVPRVRRMSAEQIVDSLFQVSGKPFKAGAMSVDIDGARPPRNSLHLGVPRRAWEFTSLSNERDRPSLALPFAQPFVTLMETFGWSGSRQSPISQRDENPIVLQAGVLANGLLSQRTTRLSDDSLLTEMALRDQPLDQLVDSIFLRILTRHPTVGELGVYQALLRHGYEDRRTGAPVNPTPQLPTDLVTWSNHLSPEASVIKQQLEAAVRKGDRPTARLTTDWRERAEDMVWALLNSPEFLFVP